MGDPVLHTHSVIGMIKKSPDPFLPVARFSFHVHHGDDPNPIGLIQVSDRVGKAAAEMPPGGGIKTPKPSRLGTNFKIKRSRSR